MQRAGDHEHEGATLDEIMDADYFNGLNKHPHNHANHVECPGEAIVGRANHGLCSKEGISIDVDLRGSEIEDFFGDNVLMKNFKYYIENCEVHPCTYDEMINPSIEGHRFKVGVSHVKVEGYDLAGNTADCCRTVNIYDTQPPKFPTTESEVDAEITIRLDDDTCDVEAGVPFAEYDIMTEHVFTTASDNCDGKVDVVKHIYDAEGTCVYNSDKDSVSVKLDLGPGTYTMVYEAVDNHADHLHLPAHTLEGVSYDDATFTTTVHKVTLNLVDKAGPYNITGCPADQFVEIDAHEEGSFVDWLPPTVTGDNCDKYLTPPDAIEMSAPQKEPGMWMEVGSHTVTYSLVDASNNPYKSECIFEVEVMQKAHPVNVVCPADVEVNTVENMRSGVVTWADPVATQGSTVLDQSHVAYVQGVYSGMMFPFGITTVHVNVSGEETGTRTEELMRYAECTFIVTVKDPFDPKVDGREYRCMDKDSTDVAPFRICDGPEVTIRTHEFYTTNFGYDTLGVVEHAALSCCQGQDEAVHECVAVPGSSHNKYCTPMV